MRFPEQGFTRLAQRDFVRHLTWIILFVGFGHSVLAMSGEETLAQVNREIEHPKLKNLEKTGLVIFIYSLLFTSLVSFFAVMIIPDNVRPDFLRQPHRWHCHVSGRTDQYQTAIPWLCRSGRGTHSCRRSEHLDRGRERCTQPRRGGWCPHQLVPEASQSLRHQLSHHQPDRRNAVD